MSDGRKYHATPLVYPVHHHPGAPHSGIVYSRALIAAYAEPLSSAMVMSYVGPVDFTNTYAGSDTLAVVKLVKSLTPIKVCEAFRRLDGTHLVAGVTFYSTQMDANVKAFHKLEVTGNSISVDTGTVGENATPAFEGASRLDRQRASRAEQDASAGLATYYFYGNRTVSTTLLELALDPDQIGHDCQIVLSGCAAEESGTSEAPYRLLSAVAWQENRG